MDEMLKKSHILIFIAILVGIIAFMSRPTYAGGAFSEVPGAVKTAGFDAKAKVAKVTIKWSKAYSRMEDGTVGDVTGYQIQYAKNEEFKNAKTVRKGYDSRKTTIKLKELNTIKKYNKYIGQYFFRVRSYVVVNGEKVYSKWSVVSSGNKVKVYAPVTLKSIKADRNTVTAEWTRKSGAKGYIVYGKKAGAKTWKKKATIKDPDETEFIDENLTYSCEYVYSVVSYRTLTSEDPSRLNTSYLKLLDDGENVYRVSIAEFTVETPGLRALFDKDILSITWYASVGAEEYCIQISKNKDFPNTDDTKTINIIKDMVVSDAESYSIVQSDVDKDNYYVRVRGTATYKDKTYVSEWSDVKLAEYGAGTYKIQYDGNGATSGVMMPESTVRGGEEFSLPDNKFSRDGYTFIGWCTEEKNMLYLDTELPIQIGMPEYADQGTVKDLADADGTVTLYACWQGSGPEAAADWAVTIAADDEFCYGPKVKNHCYFCQGGNKYYICNAFVAAAYTHGMPYFKGYRSGSTEWTWWLKNGFSDIGENAPIEDIRKGDVICCWNGSRWGHIMIAVTDGNIKNPKVVHAAGRGSDGTGTGPTTIREDKMAKRLAKYSKYHVVRYEG
ncbi:MAG: InlB B-repeat-containing protein [Eubacterium sp.]|nr:InlB B-repeat-containing protein [Eubacterium sp.]